MRMGTALLLMLAPISLAACSNAAEKQADQLDNAAAQADPAAAAVMENAADAIRNGETETNVADASSPAQAAMENAGAAQVEGSTGGQPPSSTTQAAPNTGDRTIPRPQIQGR